MNPLRLGFLASHRGSNMQAIIDGCKAGEINAEPRVVISNNQDSGAMERARQEGIPAYHLSARTHGGAAPLDAAMVEVLARHEVELVVLAGYMKKIGPRLLRAYANRIVNIHPALLPKFGGRGMYGMRIHEAVLAAGEAETGITIHIVNENYDEGPILAQCRIPVLAADTAETLAERVLRQEHSFYAEVLKGIATGSIALP